MLPVVAMAFLQKVFVLAALFFMEIYAQEQKCSGGMADLVFIVDSSGSINMTASASGRFENWPLTLRFMEAIVDKVDAGSNWRIGMVVFNRHFYHRFHLNSYTNKEDIKRRILTTRFIPTGTNTAAGLRAARTGQFITSSGDRVDAPNIAFVLTDGMSLIEADRTIPEAMNLHVASVNVFSIGITTSINESELAAISSPPHKQNENWFTTTNFDALSSIVDEITEKACEIVFDQNSQGFYKLFAIIAASLAGLFLIAFVISLVIAIVYRAKHNKAEKKLKDMSRRRHRKKPKV